MSVASACQAQVQLRGQQDVMLMHPKEDSFFRAEYRRTTNFASGECEQSCGTTPALGRKNISTTFVRAGDLLGEVYMHAEFDAIIPAAAGFTATTFTTYCNWLGYAMIEEIVALIGNKEFDRQDGEYMYMRNQIAAPEGKRLSECVGGFSSEAECSTRWLRPRTMDVPLQLWFCNDTRQTLNSIGLYWHELELKLSLRSLADLLVNGSAAGLAYTTNGLTELHFVGNFYYLDKLERALFANGKQEFIYIQHQTLGTENWAATDATHTTNIRFNHPVTDIMFAPRLLSKTSTASKHWFDYNGVQFDAAGGNIPPLTTMIPADTFDTAQIFFNNTQRTIPLKAEYLRQIIAHRSHRRISDTDGGRVYSYTFGVDVDDLLHSGSANFSRYDQASLRFTLWPNVIPAFSNVTWANASSITPHARNFQLGKFAVGMAQVKFAA